MVHLLGIKAADLYDDPANRQQAGHVSHRLNGRLCFRAQGRGKPSAWATTIGPSSFAVARLSAPTRAAILPSLRQFACDIIAQMDLGLIDHLPVGRRCDPHGLRAGIDSNGDRLSIGGGLEAESNGEWLTTDETGLAGAQPIPDRVVPLGGHEWLSFASLNVDETWNGLLHNSSFRSVLFPSTKMLLGTFSSSR